MRQREAETPSYVILIYLFQSQQRGIRPWPRDRKRQDIVRVYRVKKVMATLPTPFYRFCPFPKLGDLSHGPRWMNYQEIVSMCLLLLSTWSALGGTLCLPQGASSVTGFSTIITDLTTVLKNKFMYLIIKLL